MELKFKSIEINNFLSIGHSSIVIEDNGFVLVRGINNETSVPQSNGSGKSAIFDSIFWTLTGETLRGSDSVVNEKTHDGCKCILNFIVDDKDYTIVRTSSDKELGNTCIITENGVVLSDQTKKSKEVLSKILPSLTSDILGSIVILGQGLPYKFSSLSPIKRKDLLEVLSGSSGKIDQLKFQLDQKESKYSQDKQSLVTNLASMRSKIQGLERLKEELQTQLENSITDEDILNTRAEIDNREKEINKLKQELVDNFSSLDLPVSNLKGFISKTQQEISDLERRRSQVKTGYCPTCGRPYDNQEESLKDIKKIDDEINVKSSQIVALTSKLAGMESLYQNNKRDYLLRSNQITSLEYQKKSLEDKLKSLEDSLKSRDSLKDKIKGIDFEITDTKVKCTESEESQTELDQFLDGVGYLKRQISRDFKGYLLQEVVDFLSKRSEYYGNFLFTSGKLSVTLKGSKILIKIDDRSYENLSGGERQRADLSVQFALRDLLSVTSGFTCNFLVLDEAFDNLDAQGTSSLVNLVTSEFSDVESVFIVTHHSQISIPYDKEICIVKNSSGVSSVEGQ